MWTVPGFWRNWAATLSIVTRSAAVKLAVAAEKFIAATVCPTALGAAEAGIGTGAGAGAGAGAEIAGGGGGGRGAALATAVGGIEPRAGSGAGATVGDGGGGGGRVVSGCGASLIVGV